MSEPVTINGVTRPSDDDLHLVIMGAFGLSYGWWRLDSPTEAETDERGNPVKGWYVDVTLLDGSEDEADDKPIGRGRLTADLLWSTAIAISTGLVPHTSAAVVRECRRLIYVGVDDVDFDQATADEVLQTAVIGYPLLA